MNKSLITNLLAIICMLLGSYFDNKIAFSIGVFAFSGAITNWLAIHMLFEKVPGLYGSGVIPARFDEFKAAIRRLMMDEFFHQEHLERFVQNTASHEITQLLPSVINKLDLSPAFDKLVEVIMQSSFGSMLGMFGGVEALAPLKGPFIQSMQDSLSNMAQSEKFQQVLEAELKQQSALGSIQKQIATIIDQRLDELTPAMVKTMVQNMIKQHLGWLVVWGGVFGGAIGGIASILPL